MIDGHQQARMIEEARHATELHPTEASHFSRLGAALMRNSRIDEGETAFLNAIDLQPGDPAFPRELAHWLSTAGRSDDAVLYMRRAVEVGPDVAENNAILAHYLAQTGDFDRAETYLGRAIELAPDIAQYRNDLNRNLEIQARLRSAPEIAGSDTTVHSQAGDGMKVLVGEDGWLFLDNDSNQVIAQYEGKLLFTQEQLEEWREELTWRRDFFTSLSIPYCLMIAPNKEAVYEDALPTRIRRGEVQPIDQFLSLARTILPVSYAREQLKAALQAWSVFDKVDTHWSLQGALIACKHLDQVSQHALGVSIADFDITKHEFLAYPSTGDLGDKFTPHIVSQRVSFDPAQEKGYLQSENNVTNHGHIRTFFNESGNGRKCLIFGDSFGQNLARAVKEYFSYTMFCHSSLVDADLVKIERPDIVISEHVERFLITPPGRSSSFDIRSVIAAKNNAATTPATEDNKARLSALTTNPGQDLDSTPADNTD